MDTLSLMALLEELEDNIDDVDERLSPLLADSLSAATRKLPLLDRAKLQVTIVYAVESLLFSYLKLNGVEAKEHPVFQEIARIKQYFNKIKEAEQGTPKRRENLTLDKQAAARMIHHSLALNDRLDLERRELEAREKFLAARKLKALEASMKEKAAKVGEAQQEVEKVADIVNVDNETTQTDATSEKQSLPPLQQNSNGKKRKPETVEKPSSKLSPEQKAEKKARKKAKKRAASSA